QAVAAAAVSFAAVCIVVGDGGVAEADAGAGGNIEAATESVAAIAAETTVPANRGVVGDRAVGDGDRARHAADPWLEGDGAAEAIAAVGAGAPNGGVAAQRARGHDQLSRALFVNAASLADAANTAGAAVAAEGLVAGHGAVGECHRARTGANEGEVDDAATLPDAARTTGASRAAN